MDNEQNDPEGAANVAANLAVADSQAPNSAMSVADQYAEYGAGRMAAEMAAGYGLGGNFYSATAGEIAISMPAMSGGQVLNAVLTGISGVLAIASGTPPGLIAGGRAMASLAEIFSGTVNGMAVASHSLAGSLGVPGYSGSGGNVADFNIVAAPSTPANAQAAASATGPAAQPAIFPWLLAGGLVVSALVF